MYYLCPMENKINWILEQHRSTNHLYSDYLPYEFHLRMVVNVAKQFGRLVVDICNDGTGLTGEDILLGAWGHDTIEDTRVSYNDVVKQLGSKAADIIYALTNEKGKNRKERANDKYYEGIRNTPGAVFVKLCDRIANVQYSKMTGSRMFEMYGKENKVFMVSLGRLKSDEVPHPYEEMFQYLENLFNEN